MSTITPEPGSFRDKANRVFYRGGDVYRALSQEAFSNLIHLLSTSFFQRYSHEGKIIRTRVTNHEKLPPSIRGTWAAILQHDRIPFISYPYEWTFSMLRDAALLQLELIESAMREDMTLQDASSFNIQWRGSKPVFIDIPSFVPWRAGQSWVGYKQFCQLFLYPLLLQAHRNVPFQPWLRGSIDGISAEVCSNLLSRDFYKSGVLADVIIHAKMQKQFSKARHRVGDDLKGAGFGKELIIANLRRLNKIINGLSWREKKSEWSEYAQERNYSANDYKLKLEFIERAARRKPRKLAWDLGCNTGDFSKKIAAHAEYVVAVDGDAQVVDRMYNSLQADGPHNILPLTFNLSDPSGGLGWSGRERKAFVERGQPDFILCLALTHHLTISANIPMNEWVGWLAQFQGDLVIEFVGREDAMVQQLLRNKEGNHGDYDKDVFEAMLREYFVVKEHLLLSGGRRVIYSCEPKP